MLSVVIWDVLSWRTRWIWTVFRGFSCILTSIVLVRVLFLIRWSWVASVRIVCGYSLEVVVSGRFCISLFIMIRVRCGCGSGCLFTSVIFVVVAVMIVLIAWFRRVFVMIFVFFVRTMDAVGVFVRWRRFVRIVSLWSTWER